MRKLLLLTFILLFAFTTNVFAHTHLESSSPENGQVVTGELRDISLTFGGKIEQGSTFELSSAQGEPLPVENISIDGEVVSGTLANPLESGDYSVVWHIIGADGHPIDGEFSFTVDPTGSAAPVENKGEVNQEEAVHEHHEDGAAANDEATHEHPEENLANEHSEATEDGQLPSYLIPVIVVAVIVIIAGIFFGLRRKK